MTRKALGALSETLACKYLTTSGYKIITRNYRSRFGEIDIVASKNGLMTFIEVRSRRGGYAGYAEASFSSKKLYKIKLLSQIYMLEKGYYDTVLYRCDGICIHYTYSLKKAHLKHYKNIF